MQVVITEVFDVPGQGWEGKCYCEQSNCGAHIPGVCDSLIECRVEITFWGIQTRLCLSCAAIMESRLSEVEVPS